MGKMVALGVLAHVAVHRGPLTGGGVESVADLG